MTCWKLYGEIMESKSDSEMRVWLDNLKPGDEVFVEDSTSIHGIPRLYKCKVSRLTKKFIIVDTRSGFNKFSKTGGSCKLSSWSWWSILPITPENEKTSLHYYILKSVTELASEICNEVPYGKMELEKLIRIKDALQTVKRLI